MKRIFPFLIPSILALSFAPLSSNAQYILNELWKNKFNGADSLNDIPMAIDDVTGAVYVTGITETPNEKILLIKYDQTGKQVWSRTFNSLANTRDEAASIEIDANSNIYVVGSSLNLSTNIASIVFLKYDPNGNLLLQKLYNDPANYNLSGGRQIEVDRSGNIYIAAGSIHKNTGSTDLLLLKFNKSGVLQWQRNFDGSVDTNNDFFFMQLDATTGTLCLAGTNFTDAGEDYIVTKYNFAGTRLWTNFYDGPANRDDEPTAITLDASGNIYVTGFSEGVTSGADYATIKYNPSGILQWVQRYNGTGNSEDRPNAIVSSGTNVYVTGTSLALNNNPDFLTIKYANTGALQWTNRFDGALKGIDDGVDLTVDKSGYVYVTGAEQQKSAMVFPASWDMVTLLISPTGKQLFKLNYNGAANGNEEPWRVAIDKSDNVFIIGAVFTKVNHEDIIIVKENKFAPFKKGGFSTAVTDTAIQHIAGVIKFPSQDVFEFTVDSLNKTSDTQAFVNKLETENNYTSLQTVIQNKEDSLLNTGAELDSINDPDGNDFIVDDDLRGLLNDKHEMIIGNTLYKFINDSTTVVITNPDQATLTRVRNNDSTVFRLANVQRISATQGNYFGGKPENCTEFYYNQQSNVSDSSTVLFTVNDFGHPRIGTQYTWDYGDSTPPEVVDDPGINFPHTFPSQGQYDVCLSIVGGECDGTQVCHTVNVGIGYCNPVFNVSSMTDLTVSLQNLSYGSYTNELWNFGDGSDTTISDPVYHAYANSGTYTITLTLQGGNCDSMTYSVIVNVNGPDTSGCKRCDRRDSQKIKYDSYVTNHSMKRKAWAANYWIIQYYSIGAKTVNYSKSGGRWKQTNVPSIIASIDGNVWEDATDGSKKCSFKQVVSESKTETNKKKAKEVKKVGTRFGIGKGGIIYTFEVIYSGTPYSKTTSLSDDPGVSTCP